MTYNRSHRRDANQWEIIELLLKIGFSFKITADVDGFVDGVAGIFDFINILVEIKDPSQVPSKRKLTFMEQQFHDAWKGLKPVILMTADDVIALYNYCLKLKLHFQNFKYEVA